MPAYEFDSSGKLKEASEKELAKADKSARIIAYSSGTMKDGRPYYAYIAVPPSKYREFYERSEKRESVKLGDYGKIVASGFEKTPPPEVKQRMYETYGFDEQYEARLREAISSQRKQFSIEKEEDRLMDIVAMMKQQKK